MMNESEQKLFDALVRARLAADRLGPATDQVTETIAKIERALEEARFGVSGSIGLRSEAWEMDDETRSSEVQLAFRKEGKRWMLMIDSQNPYDDEHWQSTPLVNASRELRVLAVQKLPDLVDALANAAEARLAEVTDAQRRADDLLAALAADPVASAVKEKKP